MAVFNVLWDGAEVPPSGSPAPAPNTYEIAAIPAPTPDPDFPLSVQWQADGVDLGEPNVRVINFIAALDEFLVTRGTGEQSNVITVRKLTVPPPPPYLGIYWDPDSHSTDITLSDGNRVATGFTTGLSTNRGARGITSRTTGKWYFEIGMDNFAPNSANGYIGIAASTWTAPYENVPGLDPSAAYKGWTFATNGYRYHDGFNPVHMNGDPNNWNNLPGQPGTRTMFAVDLDTGSIYFGTDGTWRFGGDPAAGTGASYTDVVGPVWPAANMLLGASQTRVITLYSAADETLYAPPSGFSRWENP